MQQHLERYIIGAVMALSGLAVRSVVVDVHDDIRDEAAALMSIWLASADQQNLRRWCDRLIPRLDVLAGDASQPMDAILAVQVAVLRLRVILVNKSAPKPAKPNKVVPVHKPVPTKPPSAHQKKILAFVREHPDIRTKELLIHFSHSLSVRTTKRYLKDLVSAGALLRVKQDGAVLYRTTD